MPIYSTTEYKNWVETHDESEEEEEEEETIESRYEYVDARGEPILSTLIQAPSITFKKRCDPEDDKGYEDSQMFTSLGDGRRCPRALFEQHMSWSDAIRAHKVGVINAETKKRKLDRSEYKDRKAKEAVDEQDAYFMSKIPKFSKGYLEKMKIASAKAITDAQKADNKYYTWKKGARTASTSHQAWGHRRSGGGKGKTSSLQDLNSEKAHAERVAARKIRQLNNKAVAIEDMAIRKTLMARLDRQKAAETDRTKSDGCEVEQEAELPNEPTEAEIRNRQVIQYFVDKQKDHVDMIIPEFTESVAKQVKTLPIVKVCSEKKKMETSLAKSLFDASTRDVHRPSGPRTTKNTRLCMSVSKRFKCTRVNCSFAHSLDVLTIPKCNHGIKCRFIKLVGDKWINSTEKNDRICTFAHGGEINNKIDYCKRIGISI